MKARQGGKASKKVKGKGQMEIGHNEEGFVVIQFHDPEWWVHLTPVEATQMASLLLKRAAFLTGQGQIAIVGPITLEDIP